MLTDAQIIISAATLLTQIKALKAVVVLPGYSNIINNIC